MAEFKNRTELLFHHHEAGKTHEKIPDPRLIAIFIHIFSMLKTACVYSCLSV